MRNNIQNPQFWLPALTVIMAAALQSVCIPQQARADDTAAVVSANTLSAAFRSAAAKVQPAVVRILTSTTLRPLPRLPGISPRRDRGQVPSRVPPQEGTPKPVGPEEWFGPRVGGIGSGVIFDSSGKILTNNHVVAGADEVLVELADGQRFEAIKISRDPLSDLAVIWIEADAPLPAAQLGNSDRLDVGDWVLAIGSPFGLQQTVSAGIISGLQRSPAPGERSYFLQTDAAINPGSSGGPLVDLGGQVVGINTAIASKTGGYQGIGFAIPVNHANWVKDQLVSNGSVRRGYLGVSTLKNSRRLAEQLGVDSSRGVVVSKVFQNTPAERSGFLPGDLILTFAGIAVDSPQRLQQMVERSPSGSKQEVGLIRDGKVASLEVTVSALPVDVRNSPQNSNGRRSG